MFHTEKATCSNGWEDMEREAKEGMGGEGRNGRVRSRARVYRKSSKVVLLISV